MSRALKEALLCDMAQEYSEAEAASAMKRMEQHHAVNGWGDDTAQPVDVPTGDDSQPAADGVQTLPTSWTRWSLSFIQAARYDRISSASVVGVTEWKIEPWRDTRSKLPVPYILRWWQTRCVCPRSCQCQQPAPRAAVGPA
jgi:hypothetical protein